MIRNFRLGDLFIRSGVAVAPSPPRALPPSYATDTGKRERERARVLGEDAMKEATPHLSRFPPAPPRARYCQRGFPRAPGYEAGTFQKFDWNAGTLEVI